jgi:hypothetical protein
MRRCVQGSPKREPAYSGGTCREKVILQLLKRFKILSLMSCYQGIYTDMGQEEPIRGNGRWSGLRIASSTTYDKANLVTYT